jgi:hypothetical protein
LASALGQNATAEVLTAVAGTNTITGTSAQAFTAYAAGQRFQFATAGANTGAVTLNVNGRGAKSVVLMGNVQLTGGELPAGGWATVEYTGIAFMLVNSAASSAVTFLQAGTGAVTRTVQAELREWVKPQQFGAVGDGITDDRAAVQAAFAASKSVYFPSGSYYLGQFNTAANIIDLSALGAGVSIHCDNNVEFVVQTTASVMPRVFYLLNNSNFSCDPIRIRDTGYDPLLTWKGAIGFYLDCGASDNWGDVKIAAVYGSSLVAPVVVAGGNASNRIRGIRIGQLFSDNCYYGFNAQNNGDGVIHECGSRWRAGALPQPRAPR